MNVYHADQGNEMLSIEIKESETTSNEATQQLQLLPTLSAAVEPNQSTTETSMPITACLDLWSL